MSLPRSITAVLLAAACALTVPSPANAAIPGDELVWSPYAAPSSDTTRAAAAVCPSGKRLLGAFAFTSGNTRDVVITALIPTATFAIAVAHEDQDGTSDAWQLTVQVVCALPVPGHVVVSAASASTSLNKQVTAVCPVGKRALTAGWSLAGSDGEVFLNQLAQAADLSRVSATGMEDQDGFADTWRLTTYAVCADPLPGQHLRTAVSAVGSSDKSMVLVCDPDQRRLSAGWSLIGSGSGTPAGQVLAQPHSSGTTWFELIAREDDDGYAGDWFATGRIICVTV